MPKQIDHKERKRHIIEVALETFASKGFEKTAMNDIAEAASVPRPTLYHYFKNKTEILQAVVKYSTDHDLRSLRTLARDSEIAPHIRLIKMCEQMIQIGLTKALLMKAVISYLSNQVFEPDSRFMHIMRRRTIRLQLLMIQLLREGLQQGVFTSKLTPMQMKDILWSNFLATSLQIYSGDFDPIRARKQVRNIVTAFTVDEIDINEHYGLEGEK